MNRQYLFTITVLAGLMLLLASCFRFPGVQVDVSNRSIYDIIPCSGGLQATFQAGSLTIQSSKVAEDGLFIAFPLSLLIHIIPLKTYLFMLGLDGET